MLMIFLLNIFFLLPSLVPETFPSLESPRLPPDLESVVCRLTGVSSPEEVGEERMLEFQKLASRPLKVNGAAPEELRACVLFTSYQVAALQDYLERTGPLLSALELGQVDGFRPELVASYAVFLDFSLPGDRLPMQKRARHQLQLKGGLSWQGSSPVSTGGRAALRYAADDLGGWSIRLGTSWPETGKAVLPVDLTASLSWQRRRFGCIVGDMNLRFGQGLLLWNGVRFTNLAGTATVLRNPSGLSLPSSFNGTNALAGFGMKAGFGDFQLTGALSFPEADSGGPSLLPALNLSWFGRQVRSGHSIVVQTGRPGRPRVASSVDFSACIRGTDIFGEVAVDWSALRPAVVSGFRQPLGEQVVLACSGHYHAPGYSPVSGPVYHHENEAGALLTVDFRSSDRLHALMFSADFAWHPAALRTLEAGDWQARSSLTYVFCPISSWQLAVRHSIKERGNLLGKPSRYAAFKLRNELRFDIRHVRTFWETAVRTHFQYSEDFSFLIYAEGIWKPSWGSLHFRQGFFRADHWSDRIYAYERDFPLSFSVPAYCGRGGWTSLFFRAELAGWCALGVKGNFTFWYRDERRKPGKAGLKLWCAFRF